MTNKAIESEPVDPERIRCRLEELIRNFQSELKTEALRSKVLALVPIVYRLRELGKALIPSKYASSARDRILFYFRKHPFTVITGDESASEFPDNLKSMKPDDYILLNDVQDIEAAHRWNVANSIRKERSSVRDKILKFLRANIGKSITNEELRYVSGNKTEWARRVRELRSEMGRPIVTRSTGRPDLPVGVYILQADRQSPEHDRRIPDDIRREVFRRDGYICKHCGWSHVEWNPSDPRHLELHHVEHHANGGENTKENLITLCKLCHDKIHRKKS